MEKQTNPKNNKKSKEKNTNVEKLVNENVEEVVNKVTDTENKSEINTKTDLTGTNEEKPKNDAPIEENFVVTMDSKEQEKLEKKSNKTDKAIIFALMEDCLWFGDVNFGRYLLKKEKTSDQDLFNFYNELQASNHFSTREHYEVLRLLKNYFA